VRIASSLSPNAENIHNDYVFPSRIKYFKTAFKAYWFKAWGRNKSTGKFMSYSIRGCKAVWFNYLLQSQNISV